MYLGTVLKVIDSTIQIESQLGIPAVKIPSFLPAKNEIEVILECRKQRACLCGKIYIQDYSL